ncbi:glycoside hydrolase family 3 protein [bacterium]|nr:glycoside hydrolase family 3 protein [bacterium]
MSERLSVGEAALLAGRLVVGLGGPEPTPDEWAWLGQHRPAGVILFGRNVTGPAQAARLCRRLRDLAPGLQVMADHEGGPVAQMAAAAGRPPAAWALGALDDPDLTRAVCRETARRLARVGITRVLGPVADVLEHPRNPVIGARAFGADPSLCARHVAAAVTGYRDAGLQVCVKHWPGHGGTATDSHLSLEAQLVAGCREPFLAGLTAGADAVMVGHLPVALPGGDQGLATLEAGYLSGVQAALAGAGTGPLLVADDVTMGALREPMRRLGVPRPDSRDSGLVEPGDLPVGWLRALLHAGCGLLLLRGIPWRALPASGAPAPGSASAPAAEPGDLVELTRPAPVWQEARERLWRREATGWAAPGQALTWLDATAGDRWGAADQRGGQDFAARLAGLFARVARLDGAAPGPAACERLLVTSHRPLAAGALDALRPAPGGVALAMGHPSLAGDLRARLPDGWRIGQVYDCDGLDLGTAPGGPAPDPADRPREIL